MTDDELQELIKQADSMADRPVPACVNFSLLRHRVRYRRQIAFTVSAAAAAIILIAIGTGNYLARIPTGPDDEQLVALQTQMKALQTQTDAAIELIQEVLDEERRLSQLRTLETQRASISDPLEEMEKQFDRTAFILVYQADRLYRELNQTDSAVEAYKRVIQLCPSNRWATVARERLSEIESRKLNTKGT